MCTVIGSPPVAYIISYGVGIVKRNAILKHNKNIIQKQNIKK